MTQEDMKKFDWRNSKDEAKHEEEFDRTIKTAEEYLRSREKSI
jgi:hypothetical protein